MCHFKWNGIIIVLFLACCTAAQAEIIYEEFGAHYVQSRDGYFDNDSYQTSYAQPAKKKIRHYARASRVSQKISGYGEKVIIVDPNTHRWAAYSADGTLLRSGLATAGSRWCRDIGRPCRTRSGSFRINSLGSWGCVSSKYPVGVGGARMPYCMFFNGGQGIHGSYEVVAANVSHGCVRVSVSDAEWIRFNFARIGTKIIIRPY